MTKIVEPVEFPKRVVDTLTSRAKPRNKRRLTSGHRRLPRLMSSSAATSVRAIALPKTHLSLADLITANPNKDIRPA